MTREVRTFGDFIDAAVERLGGHNRGDAFFISGETLADALRRWWGDVLHLTVTGDHEFSWICSGAATT